MLTCKQVSELVALSLDRRLGWLERWRLSPHLKACEGCRNFSRQMTFLRTVFGNHPVIKEDREDKNRDFGLTRIQSPGHCVLSCAAGTDGRNQADRQSHWKENGIWKAEKSWVWR